MQGEFEMSMMVGLKFFLGLKIKQCEDGIFINQEKYTKEVLKKFGVMNMKSIRTPMSPSTKLDKDDKGKNVDQNLYRDMIGKLIEKALVVLVNSLATCLCLSLVRNKIPLLYQLLKLSIYH
ncbi:Reverse transcriptase [Theobroma cacao]|nr:Reverse transcriptase [Theobroma cacao]